MDMNESKADIRRQLRAQLAAIGSGVRLARSEEAAARLCSLPAFCDARTVMLYLPFGCEVNTQPIAEAAGKANKRVVAPDPCPRTRQMRAVVCDPSNDDLFLLTHGLRTPLGETWDVESIDLIVVPALGFDRTGHRLGRGGGFYDRFLARDEMRAVTVGLGFAEQIVPSLPIEETDHPVQVIVTDREVVYCANER
jgi:5-formyltetrahydrofolate cyclo-ligase